jgi:tRNA threonylcarbamoyl adenosine modification protein (Sua5/YciO/YrdC/YwlC family)
MRRWASTKASTSELDMSRNLAYKKEDLITAVDILRGGGIVAYPTDTTYALAVDALNPNAVQKLAELKNRDSNKPISISLGNIEDLKKYSYLSEMADQIVYNFLPGPLTIILPSSFPFPGPIVNHDKMVGFRVPNNKLCLDLVAAFGNPITATSANPRGSNEAVSISDFNLFSDSFTSHIDCVLKGTEESFGVASTVIQVCGGECKVIREGALQAKLLNNFVLEQKRTNPIS